MIWSLNFKDCRVLLTLITLTESTRETRDEIIVERILEKSSIDSEENQRYDMSDESYLKAFPGGSTVSGKKNNTHFLNDHGGSSLDEISGSVPMNSVGDQLDKVKESQMSLMVSIFPFVNGL